MASTLGRDNPFRYRGYYYDTETGFYYLNARYYNPEWGRWISSEPNVDYGGFDAGAGNIGYNLYVYCANNPVNFSDPTGEFIITALIVGVVAGAVVGGAVGGTVAYNAAKSSGLEGADLFWATAGGVGKGVVIGGFAGGLLGATGGVVAAIGTTAVAAGGATSVIAAGATSIAGTAMITMTATIAAHATGVGILQARKSINDGDNGWQVANDCLDSIFYNRSKIISPTSSKARTTAAFYWMKNMANPIDPIAYLKSSHNPFFSWAAVSYQSAFFVGAISCDDPVLWANFWGYELK